MQQGQELELGVDIVFWRHAQAASNIPAVQGGLDVTTCGGSEFATFLSNIKNGKKDVPVSNGCYWMDGLTSKGLSQAHQASPQQLKNVYGIVSSPCTRAFQTANLKVGSFELVGEPRIQIDKRIQEATPWSQDTTPILQTDNGRVYTRYLEFLGGSDSDAGRVVKEVEVDYTHALWRQDVAERDPQTVEGRLAALKHPKTIEEIQKALGGFLVDEFAEGKKDLEEHLKSGREGTPRRVWVSHGGVFNLLEGIFHCEYVETPDGNWCWKGSASLRPMQVRVFRLHRSEDGTVLLKEKPRDSHYEEVFGSLYRHLASELSLQYKNADGSLVDQKKGYFDFWNAVRDEVVNVAQRQEQIMRQLLRWKGLQEATQQTETWTEF
ncbi:hypothetical protein AK830_g4262 [Neonectria ditissima]|uniref:Uncharacterized protein n=1 Tax=Neonectria ditissima TaxID=78410 RepID=A0A0P7BLP2_9HYPO|nr:hypothetical protein AK830_g4262 [Neonectria ditissima]